MLSKNQIARSIVVASLAVFLSGSAFANSGARPAVASRSEATLPAGANPSTGVAPTTGNSHTAETQRYASREASARPLESFRGGDGGIYIGGGALVTALLIVLLIVLI